MGWWVRIAVRTFGALALSVGTLTALPAPAALAENNIDCISGTASIVCFVEGGMVACNDDGCDFYPL